MIMKNSFVMSSRGEYRSQHPRLQPDFAARLPSNHYKKLTFGFFGEIGGVLAALKKQGRDQLYVSDAEIVRDEIGDALWYVVNAARLSKVAPADLGGECLDFLRLKLSENRRRQNAPTTFRQLTGIASLHHARLTANRDAVLRELASDCGSATALSYERMIALPKQDRAMIYGRLLGQLVLVSTSFGLELETIARQNLSKIYDRWPTTRKYFLLPSGGDGYEQLPARLKVDFIQRKVGSRVVVVQQIKGLNIGDPLTDNSHRPDGYRFHDVFHLSYAAHLGWSPVIRALLKLKRKSKPELDENEDGARAIILEEGISTWIFNHARSGDRNLYADITTGRLDYALLKQIRNMVDGLMVAQCPLWQWENAILDGFRVFRELNENTGGSVLVDLQRHTLKFTPHPRPH
jgi:hypothetical protein